MSDDRKQMARRELARRELARREQAQTQQSESKPPIERQNAIGATFNVPGATSRAAIQSNPALAVAGPLAGLAGLAGAGGQEAQQAAGQGALNPSEVPTFQDQAIQAGQNAFGGPSTSVAVNFAKGLVPSAVGLAADMWTDPTTVLTSLLIGIKPAKVKTTASVIDKSFHRAISPSVSGIKNQRGANKLKIDSRSGVESIVDNKQNLNIADSAGEVIEGKLPGSVDEFSQSISQTEKNIFNQFDEMSKKAGETGIAVDTKTIANEILGAITTPQINDLSPSVQKYGLELAGRLEKRGKYTLQEAQDVIESLNNKLKTYFQNPTPDSLQQAVIDRAVVGTLRKQMVEAVERKSGPGYDILRRQYGSLRAIDESVTKQAFRLSNNKVGPVDKLLSIVSSADIGHGLATFNAGLVMKGGFQLGMKSLYNRMINPNNIIKKMFQDVDRIKNVEPQSRVLRHLVKTKLDKENLKSSEMAIQFGDSIKGDKVKIAELKNLRVQVSKQVKDLIALDNPTKAQEQMTMNLATKNQLFREALQVAEGTADAAENSIITMSRAQTKKNKIARMRVLKGLIKKGSLMATTSSAQKLMNQ